MTDELMRRLSIDDDAKRADVPLTTSAPASDTSSTDIIVPHSSSTSSLPPQYRLVARPTRQSTTSFEVVVIVFLNYHVEIMMVQGRGEEERRWTMDGGW